MSGLQPDEKTCPFCAETIKAAAVKCRYCGSELPPVEKPRPAMQRPPVEVKPASTWEAPAAVSVPAVRSSATTLLVLLLVAGILAVWLAVMRANADETAPDGTVTSNSARAVAMQRAADSTATILSYKAGTFDADAAKAGKLMTSDMRKDYLKALAPVKAKVVEDGIELKATVVASSLTYDKGNTIRALLFVNQSTTADGAANEQLDNNRVLVTMKRVKGDWLISKMKPF